MDNPIECLICGEILDHEGKFCSTECERDYRHENRTCTICGGEFWDGGTSCSCDNIDKQIKKGKNLQKLEELRQKALHSPFRQVAYERFVNDINIKDTNYYEVFNWFVDYFSNSTYIYNIVMANMAKQVVESGDYLRPEIIKALEDVNKSIKEIIDSAKIKERTYPF